MAKYLSASELGYRLNLTAQEMNALLEEEGYLEGEPGNYRATGKAEPYVSERGWHNGYGGYAARGYSIYVWDKSILRRIDTSKPRLGQIRQKTAEHRKRRRLENQMRNTSYQENNNQVLNSNTFESSASKEQKIDIIVSALRIGFDIVMNIKQSMDNRKEKSKVNGK